jgi:NhaP-type Na+/H+ or K+/H+ antiporter
MRPCCSAGRRERDARRGIAGGALALPLTTAAGGPFPERGLIVFLAFAVILFTLVVPGLSLPALIGRLQISTVGPTPTRSSMRGWSRPRPRWPRSIPWPVIEQLGGVCRYIASISAAYVGANRPPRERRRRRPDGLGARPRVRRQVRGDTRRARYSATAATRALVEAPAGCTPARGRPRQATSATRRGSSRGRP